MIIEEILKHIYRKQEKTPEILKETTERLVSCYFYREILFENVILMIIIMCHSTVYINIVLILKIKMISNFSIIICAKMNVLIGTYILIFVCISIYVFFFSTYVFVIDS